METIKRVSDLDPQDLPLLERVFGRRLNAAADAELVLRVPETQEDAPDEDLPAWCNVLEGLSDEDLAEFKASLRL
jgi:hypothetical protein